ncbi:MAG: 3-oxoacyl-ACP reductase FabG [Gammaproteobacteria bacterium]|nr:3-oxoacyl-ACP reductase FabG [Gammaproteobacteria bacterium]
MADLAQKVALVTGASRGIGRAAAIALAREGVDVGVHYHVQEAAARATCDKINEIGRRSVAIQADVSKTQDIQRLLDTVEESLGRVQILINNAGIIHRAKVDLDDMSEEDWDRVMDINLKSAFLVTQGVLKGMREQKWGRIIFLSSIAAQTGGVTGPIYVASKAGLLGLTHSYASMLVKEGITANAIAPALVETDLVKELNVTPALIPVGRFGSVEEVADVVIMLVKNGYMTGQTINVNGGWYYS